MNAQTPQEIPALPAAAFDARDSDAVARLYEDDATLIVPPEGTRVTGRDAIRTTVEPKLALASSFRSEVVELLEAGDLALTQTRWSLGTDLSGRGVIVSRRQPDGSWRIVLDNPLSPD